MSNSVNIRPITADDTDILWQMLFYAAHADEDYGETVESIKANDFLPIYVEKWGQPDDLGFIAEHNAKPVGAVWIRLFEGETYPELAIAVLPDAIGQGIGSQLMQTIIDACQSKYDTITLSVRDNNPAYRLDQRFGFETVKEITNRVGTKSYEMHLTLK